MLTRKIVYLISMLAIILINIMYVEYSPYIVLLIMILLPLTLYIYIFVTSKLISVHTKMEDQTVDRGDKIKFEIIVNNISIFPAPNITVMVEYKYNNCNESMYKQFVINAKVFEKTRVSGNMMLNYCGNLSVGITKAYIYDPLKIFRRKIQCDDYNHIIVMPKLVEPDYYTLHTPDSSIIDSSYYSKKNVGNDSSEIFDIREYKDGDNISRIHWKLSAKQDKFIVKKFSMPINKSNVILVELFDSVNEQKRKNLDGVYELVYAIGNFACMKERRFKLIFYSTELKGLKTIEIESKNMLIEAIHILIEEGTYLDRPYALNEFQITEMSEIQRVYYITSNISNEIIEFLDEKKDTNFFIYNMEDGTQVSESLEIKGAMLFNVDRDDIKQCLNTILI